MAYARTSYTGPLKNRGVDAQGRAKVSREELADFKAQYGQDKTLRDLLNADRTGRPPAPAEPVEKRYPGRQNDEGKARGLQGANLLSRQEQRYPGKREQPELDPRARGIQGLNELPDEERPIPVDAQGKRIGPTIQRAKDLAQEQRIRAAEKARYEDMTRPGRDAIEPIMPEAFLIGPARGAAAALQNALVRRKAAKDVVRKGEPEGALPSATRGGKKDPELELEDLKDYAGGRAEPSFKRGGAVKARRGDGICKRGHTKGTMR